MKVKKFLSKGNRVCQNYYKKFRKPLRFVKHKIQITKQLYDKNYEGKLAFLEAQQKATEALETLQLRKKTCKD